MFVMSLILCSHSRSLLKAFRSVATLLWQGFYYSGSSRRRKTWLSCILEYQYPLLCSLRPREIPLVGRARDRESVSGHQKHRFIKPSPTFSVPSLITHNPHPVPLEITIPMCMSKSPCNHWWSPPWLPCQLSRKRAVRWAANVFWVPRSLDGGRMVCEDHNSSFRFMITDIIDGFCKPIYVAFVQGRIGSWFEITNALEIGQGPGKYVQVAWIERRP